MAQIFLYVMPAMIDYSTNTEKLSHQVINNASIIPDSVPALKVIRKNKAMIKMMDADEEGPGEKHLPFHKWKIPTQPIGYIKCRRHDFL